MGKPPIIREERVAFEVDSVDVVGVLRVPLAQDASAALVFAGPLTSVKEQATGNYAVALAARGFITLTFDHRHFGESGGAPRQYAHPAKKVEDFRAAFGFLSQRPEVDSDRIGAVGICSGAGYLAPVVAGDDRVRAWGAVAGFFHDASEQRDLMGEDFDRELELAGEARERFEDSGDTELVRAVERGDALEYFGTERGKVPTYVNALARMSREHILSWDAQSAAYDITVPTMMVHSDNARGPSLARRFFEALAGLKEQVWIESDGHVDFYDQPRQVSTAADHLTRHFKAYL
jgi:fermentation-respiration switch protein FrsA (DUF1100 family)